MLSSISHNTQGMQSSPQPTPSLNPSLAWRIRPHAAAAAAGPPPRLHNSPLPERASELLAHLERVRRTCAPPLSMGAQHRHVSAPGPITVVVVVVVVVGLEAAVDHLGKHLAVVLCRRRPPPLPAGSHLR